MPFTTTWSPNQAAIAQLEAYTFSAPVGVGNTYTATMNGKSVTYTSVSGDTATTVATALYTLLATATTTGQAAELGEVQFSNPSAAVVTAQARIPGTPFAGVTVNGVAGQGLVMSTGNGLANGIATAHTAANASPSDVNDPQNWLRINTGTVPPSVTRALPQDGDDVVLANSNVPLLWNLDRLAAVRFNTYTRWQSFTATVGLPETNPAGYTEWRATYFKFNGPAGSVPAGGLQMVLGQGSGAGPTRERYDLQSSQYTLTVLAAGQAEDEYGVRVLGQHTQNTFTLLGGVSLGVAMTPGETAVLTSSKVDGGGVLGVGAGVTWTAGATLTMLGGRAALNSAPATLTATNGATVIVTADLLTWPTVTAQGGTTLAFLAGGIVTSLTLSTSSRLDKSGDARGLTIVNHTIDGDTCQIIDPLNAVTFTNAGTVKQQVTSGPYLFTGMRTVKVT